MKKKLVSYLFLLLLFIFIFLFFLISRPKQFKYKIAILYPISHPALEDISKGFQDEIKKEIKSEDVKFDIYNGNGDRILMVSQVKDIFSDKKYNLVCSITTGLSVLCNQESKKTNSSIPILCTAVSEYPNEVGLIGDNLCCISDHMDFFQQIETIKSLTNVDEILLLYSNSDGLLKQIDEITKISSKMNIKINPIAIFNQNEI